MNTIDTVNNWNSLVWLLLLLVLLYGAIHLLIFSIKNYSRKNFRNKIILQYLEFSKLIFQPFALVFLLLKFISINYITHGILLLIIVVFCFKQIRDYISGVFLKTNPLIHPGAAIIITVHEGEIKSLLPFGLIINTERGERYIHYYKLEKKGFAVSSHGNVSLRQTLFLKTELSKERILDLLFGIPILDYCQKTTINREHGLGYYKLNYTLALGARKEDLLSFLNNRNIITCFTGNFEDKKDIM